MPFSPPPINLVCRIALLSNLHGDADMSIFPLALHIPLCPLPGMSHGHFSFSSSEVPWPFVYCYILDSSDYLPYARTSNELVRKFNMISSTANFECKYATVEMAHVGWNS
jgi:hypothetical protein